MENVEAVKSHFGLDDKGVTFLVSPVVHDGRAVADDTRRIV